VLARILAVGARRSGPEGTWSRVHAPVALEFPRDHGAHLDARTEWWYLTGELEAGGRRFGWQVTIFRLGLDPSAPEPDASPLRARHALASHVVLVDVDSGTTQLSQRLRRLDGALAWASAADLDAGIDGVELRREGDGTLRVTARAPEAGFALDLTLAPRKPLVLHGDGGVSAKGPEPGNASVYASWTRLAARGSLEHAGRRLDAAGEAWFDHEYGTSQLGEGVVGWDWTGLRLADGRELMLYRLRRADGAPSEHSSGTLVERDGRARRLTATEFQLAPAGTWTSPATRAVYPVRWRVRVPSAGIDGELAARVPGCEVDGRASTGTVYWEGPAQLTGSAPGSGYLELSGYATSLAARF
jgi:predicted secreted hydrolase